MIEDDFLESSGFVSLIEDNHEENINGTINFHLIKSIFWNVLLKYFKKQFDKIDLTVSLNETLKTR